MTELLDSLYNHLQTPGFPALTASFAWGILSMVLSPCHLSSVPVFLGHISSRQDNRRPITLSLIFSSGVIISILVIGIVSALTGRILGDMGIINSVGTALLGLILILMGLFLLNWIPERIHIRTGGMLEKLKENKSGTFGLGAVYGLGTGPCTFAFMAPVLALTLKQAGTNFLFAVTLAGAFALGHCLIFLIAGPLVRILQNRYNWTANKKLLKLFRKGAGLLLLTASVPVFIQLFS